MDADIHVAIAVFCSQLADVAFEGLNDNLERSMLEEVIGELCAFDGVGDGDFQSAIAIVGVSLTDLFDDFGESCLFVILEEQLDGFSEYAIGCLCDE